MGWGWSGAAGIGTALSGAENASPDNAALQYRLRQGRGHISTSISLIY